MFEKVGKQLLITIFSLLLLSPMKINPVHAETTTGTFISCAEAVGLPQEECEILVALYNSTGGPSWNTNFDWLQTDLVCSWYGVNCWDGVVLTEHVQKLELWGNGLTGVLSVDFSGLTNLSRLDLSLNQLTGDMSTIIGNMPPSLEYLSLSDSLFTGTIPTDISTLSNLIMLDLDNNEIAGNLSDIIPNLPSSIETLWLDLNNFSGTIPPEISNLSLLTRIGLSDNPYLEGNIPLSITNLSVVYLDFQGTYLCEPNDPAYDIWKAGISNYYPGVCAFDAEAPTGSFLTPNSNGTLLRPRAMLKVEANDDLSGVKNVTFKAYYDGEWHTLNLDEDASDGWQYVMPTYNIPDQTLKLQAVIKDYVGKETPIELENISLTETIVSVSGYEAKTGSGDEDASPNDTPTHPIERSIIIPTKNKLIHNGRRCSHIRLR